MLKSLIRGSYAAPGYLLFVRNRALFAKKLDPDSLELGEAEVSIAEQIGHDWVTGAAAFSASENGVLVYRSATDYVPSQLAWYDRTGNRIQIASKPGVFHEFFLSPDEKRVAIATPAKRPSRVLENDIWLLELSTGVLSFVSFGSAPVIDPTWSPDSRRILVSSNLPDRSELLEADIFSGRVSRVFSDKDSPKFLDHWTDAGLIYRAGTKVILLPMKPYQEPKVLMQNSYPTVHFQFSPDNRWITYSSPESGRGEVYVASFPHFNQKRQVSVNGGNWPFWRRDGKELFFTITSLEGLKVMAVDVNLGASIEAGVPKLLFEVVTTNANLTPLAVTGDGRSFLIVEPLHRPLGQIGVVLNWHEALRN
jgi:Tol biopolymer transport system component